MAKILPAAKCSQMSNPKSGTGSGGDRCVAAVAAMIDSTYKIGPKAAAGESPEQLMYAFTEEWNQGKDVSAMEPNTRIDEFVNERKVVSIEHWPGLFANVQQTVDKGHISYAAVKDYRQLRLLGGGNPYQWNLETQPAAGHCLLVVGYGDGVVVHDPLRSEDGQPAEYSVTAFEAAGWYDLGEVVGASLFVAPPAEAQTHVIAPGETFWSIAERFYGNPELYPLLEAANPHCDPRALKIGTAITIPPKPETA